MSAIHHRFGAVGAESTESEDWQKDKSEKDREEDARTNRDPMPGMAAGVVMCGFQDSIRKERERVEGRGWLNDEIT